jgi:hypothetical protein
MSEADEHILSQIEHAKCKITGLWVGLYGNPESDSNKRIISRVERMVRYRQGASKALTASYYDAQTAAVWG